MTQQSIHNSGHNSGHPSGPQAGQKSRGILLIDENLLTIKLCEMVLTKAGLGNVFVAARDQAKVVLAKHQEEIGLILLEATTHGRAAQTLLEYLDRSATLRNIPVIPMINREASEVFFAGFPAVLYILKKPFAPSDLLEAIFEVADKMEDHEIAARRKAMLKSYDRSHSSSITPAEYSARAPALAFEGQIALMPLAEILQLLHLQRQTGRLRVADEEREISIFIEKGEVRLVTGHGFGEDDFKLGRILIRQEKLDPALLRSFLANAARQSSPLGQVLIKRALLEPESLVAALEQQVRDLLFQSLNWSKGRFSFEKWHELPDLARKTGVALSLEGLLLESLQMDEEVDAVTASHAHSTPQIRPVRA